MNLAKQQKVIDKARPPKVTKEQISHAISLLDSYNYSIKHVTNLTGVSKRLIIHALRKRVSVHVEGGTVIVDLGDYVLNCPMPMCYKSGLSDARCNRFGIVFVTVNEEEDFFAINCTVLGEPPFYVPSEYSIVKDKKNLGVQGLQQFVRLLYA